MLQIEDGMKVRINENYCDVSDDGWSRKSDIRYVVVAELSKANKDFCLLADTKKNAINGYGRIYHRSVIEKVIGWWC